MTLFHIECDRCNHYIPVYNIPSGTQVKCKYCDNTQLLTISPLEDRTSEEKYIINPLDNIDPSELLNNEVYRWIHNAVCRVFTDSAYMYYCDKNDQELFTIFILTAHVLKGEEGSEKVEILGMNDEQRSIILSRIDRIENNDPNIVEVPRLRESDWKTLMVEVILKNEGLEESERLKRNLLQIIQEEFCIESILTPFLDGINNEKIEDDANEILNNMSNNTIYEFLKMVDGNEDIDVMEVLNSLKIVEDFKMKVG